MTRDRARETAAGIAANLVSGWLGTHLNNLDAMSRDMGLDPQEFELLKQEMLELVDVLKRYAGSA